jgi:hypothetical protein
MRYVLFGAIVLSILVPLAGIADDCVAHLTDQQRQIYSGLSPTSQQVMTTQIKTREGKPASCEFRGGILDMLNNFPPEKRDAAFKQLVDKMLIHQQ